MLQTVKLSVVTIIRASQALKNGIIIDLLNLRFIVHYPIKVLLNTKIAERTLAKWTLNPLRTRLLKKRSRRNIPKHLQVLEKKLHLLESYLSLRLPLVFPVVAKRGLSGDTILAKKQLNTTAMSMTKRVA